MKKKISILILFFCVSFSYAQCDTVVEKDIIDSWILIDNFSEKEIVEMDTFLENFQTINPIFRNSISNTTLGNFGMANISNVYFDRKQNNLFFLQAYDLYFLNPEKNVFYNTKKPYTNLSYAKSGAKGREEELLEVIHTQNVNPFFNVGFTYNLISSIGKYNRQEVKNNSYSLWTSYEKNRYSIHGNWNSNKFRIYENGGLSNDEDFTNGSNTSLEYIDVNLDDAKSEILDKSLLIVQKYDLGKTITEIGKDSIENDVFVKKSTIVHKLQLERKSRLYEDGIDTIFYNNIFLDSIQTYDSAAFKLMTNTFQWNFEKMFADSTSIFYNFSLSNKLSDSYYYNENEILSSSFIGASARNNISKNVWNINSQFCFEGYNQGEYFLNAILMRRLNLNSDSAVVAVKLKYSNSSPDYFLQNYNSNYFGWANDFVTEKRLSSNILFNIPSRFFKIGLNYALISNHIYFNELAIPVQSNDEISIVSANIDKAFKFWRFKTNHKFVVQYSDNKAIAIPKFATYNSIFYEQFLLKKVLKVQLGVDFYYNTKFYSYAFMPSTNVFYLQNEKLIGEHPYFDIFLNIKLKTVRFFLKYSHINSEISKLDYFSALHYPLNPMTFKSGLSWTFYD
ncbi:MAG: putative porin [Bacteroidetes bacterium]|nr:putative porin [Bacteroidota bacterium]MBT6686227.1 putative porin [Bacteroidota bacterium]MBT7144300.1 putative porin [Bacteroidota bacterium]MBT7493519.1 putative porin [Bacteroidota bacterium]